MKTSELIRTISKKSKHNKKIVKKVIELFLEEIKERMDKDEKVILKNFGTFEMIDLNEKVIGYFNSGRQITIPRRKKVKFKISENFFKE